MNWISNTKQVTKYIKHWLQSYKPKGFGIHSPFIFHLVTEIIHDTTPFYCYADIEKQRNLLLQNNKQIMVTDYGLGSKVLKGRNKKVSDIAKYSLKPKNQAQLLFRLINHFGCHNIIEIGTSLGITTSYLASVSSKSKVITLEGCPEISKQAQIVFKALKLNNIELITGNFSETLPLVLKKINTPDFIFFDGNHTKQATINYFNICLQSINNNTVFVFDDIHLSSEMELAWQEIKENNEVKVTIDLFHIGIVLFRKELTSQKFNVRFPIG